MIQNTHNRSDIIYFFILLIILVMSAGGHIVQGDSETMFRVTQNLVNGNGFPVGKEVFTFPAQPKPLLPEDDMVVVTTSAVPGRDDRTYSKYGLGQSLLSLPLYFLGDMLEGLGSGKNQIQMEGWSSRLWVSMLNPLALAGCGWLMMVFSRSLGYSPQTSLWASIAALFSTMMWPYVKEFYPQPSVAFFLTLSVYAAYRWKVTRFDLWAWVLAGSMGLMILIRLSSLVALVPIVVYLFFVSLNKRNWQWMMPLMIGVGVGLLVTAAYNLVRFDSIFQTGYQEVAWDYPFFLGLYGLLFSPGKGFFLYAPLTILSGIGMVAFAQRNKAESLLIGGIGLFFLLFYAPYNFWTGGFNWGPRFLLPIIPLLILPLGSLLEGKVFLGGKTFFYVLFILGLLVQLPAILVDHSRYLFSIIEDEGSSVTYSDTVFDIKHSPLVNQWPTAIEMIRSYTQTETKKIIEDKRNSIKEYAPSIQNGPAILLSDFIRRNTIDFWWLNLPAWYLW